MAVRLAAQFQTIFNFTPSHFLPGGSGAKDPDSDTIVVYEPTFMPQTSSWVIRLNGKDVVQAWVVTVSNTFSNYSQQSAYVLNNCLGGWWFCL